MNTLQLRHIEVFHAVYSCGSISSAAKLLHVTQPAISKSLQHAESRLGYLLFERHKGRLIPTDEARILFVEAKNIS